MSTASGFKSEHEGHLLQVSKNFDGALSSRSTSKLDSILDDNVTVHKDGITLGEDVTGKDAVKAWLGAYIDKYSFSHEVIAGAVDEQAQVTFSFWQDKDVKLAPSKLDEELPESAKAPSRTVGVWHLQLDPAGERIQHIWFLRQLSADEAHRKLKESLPQEIKFNPEDFKGSDVEPGPDRAKRNQEVASIYNNVWKTGDAGPADDILAEDTHQYQPLLGHELVGKDEWKKMIGGFAKSWETTDHESRIAVSAGDKAFIWWHNRGIQKESGKSDTLYGLNVLRMNEAGKIQAIVGFRQLTGSESEKYIKENVQR